MSNKPDALFRRRRERVRFRVRQAAKGRPRLSVFRSSRHIYVQIIDDKAGRTVAAASTLEAAVKPNVKSGANREAATAVGKLIAERAKAAGIDRVVFDRGAYLFHGRIKALADAAREAACSFREGTGWHAPRVIAAAATVTASSAKTRNSPKSWSTSIASPRS